MSLLAIDTSIAGTPVATSMASNQRGIFQIPQQTDLLQHHAANCHDTRSSPAERMGILLL
ncbi:hypothetical protein FHT82_005547 [Rhizobium sp. BK275]|nr:hypothetical protein [Rhizobium sp. BK275]